MMMPTVSRYMTANPLTVAPADLITAAHDLMREHGVRHLPVVHDGKLIGIVTDRTPHTIETLRYVPVSQVTVARAMQRDVSTIAHDTPLDEAIERMSQQRCDALVVVGKTKVMGIFTTSDALWALTDLLRREAA